MGRDKLELEQRVEALEKDKEALEAAVRQLVAILSAATPTSAWMRTTWGDRHPALQPYDVPSGVVR